MLFPRCTAPLSRSRTLRHRQHPLRPGGETGAFSALHGTVEPKPHTLTAGKPDKTRRRNRCFFRAARHRRAEAARSDTGKPAKTRRRGIVFSSLFTMPPPSAKRQPANRRFAAPLLRAGCHSSAATPASVSEEYDFSYRPDRESGLFRNAAPAADRGSSEPCGPRFIRRRRSRPRGAFRRLRPLLPSVRNAQGPAVRHRGGNARARGEMRAATPGQPKNRERSGLPHGGGGEPPALPGRQCRTFVRSSSHRSFLCVVADAVRK